MANTSQIECLCQMASFTLSESKTLKFADMYTRRLIHHVHVFKTYKIKNINVLACFNFTTSTIYFACDNNLLDNQIEDERYQAILFILKKDFENVSVQRNGKLKPNFPIDPPLIKQIKEITEDEVESLSITKVNQLIYGFVITFKKYVNIKTESLLTKLNRSKLFKSF